MTCFSMTKIKRNAKQNNKNTENPPLSRPEGTTVIYKSPHSYFQDLIFKMQTKKLEINLKTSLALVGYTAE